MKTRTDMNMRKRKSKRNIILNSLIVVVFALILMIGGNMIFGSSATTDDQQNSDAGGGGSNSQEEDIKITEDNNADQKSETTTSNRQEGEDQAEEASREDENAIDRLEIHESEKEGNEDTQQDQEENESQQDDNDINSDMIGEPIGTSQTGEHTSSYEKGSVDWNEKVDAIQKVTGLDDSMTLWRLESGDGPQEAVGKVSPEGVQDWMYVVNLQWVDQKGWKVTSVDRQNR
ncbi:YrrS family protein [Lentibacillus sp.]|uniref:YrrS family protein n=1 Tax=Lentibacillus sp. TaxID=1925746 RepID=UPI002B4ADF82|nr:DUF1510 family protein [Lentibacillus sp.]HLS10319.1 DUF1510 family protein [Lentibacillus sp.]